MDTKNGIRFSGIFYELSVVEVDKGDSENLFPYVYKNQAIPQEYSHLEETLRNNTQWAGYVRHDDNNLFSIHGFSQSDLLKCAVIKSEVFLQSDRGRNLLLFHKITTDSISEVLIESDFSAEKLILYEDDFSSISSPPLHFITPYYDGKYFDFISSLTYCEIYTLCLGAKLCSN